MHTIKYSIKKTAQVIYTLLKYFIILFCNGIPLAYTAFQMKLGIVECYDAIVFSKYLFSKCVFVWYFKSTMWHILSTYTPRWSLRKKKIQFVNVWNKKMFIWFPWLWNEETWLTNVVCSATSVYFNPFQGIKLPSYKEISYNHEFW